MSEHEKFTEEEIEQTSDEFSDEIEDKDEPISIQADVERKILSSPHEITIREFFEQRNEGDLIIQPEYQRNFVASPSTASKYIESILMDVPIPVIYLAEEKGGKRSVIDGQQRLTSFLSFLDGRFPNGSEFRLTGLKVLSELNRKSFHQLDQETQKKIKKTSIRTIVISKDSNEDIKFEIFERLNTGSIKLNEDELRNSIYRGQYIKLLSELSENETFHDLVKKENFKKRMIYRGMILRFLALSEKSYINYKPSMKQFCNKELRDHRNLSEQKAKEYTDRFKHCVDLVKVVFGESAFRRYMPMTDSSKAGSWSSSRINMALFDIQMGGFVNYTKNQVLAKADFIREAMVSLMTNNQDFIASLEIRTSDREMVKKRFKIWLETLDDIIGDDSIQNRLFPLSVKDRLFKENPYCAISGNKILSIDDAEVDHIVPFSKGGQTVFENAQLVLRYFNRAKKNNDGSN